jgi:hypothetical protein
LQDIFKESEWNVQTSEIGELKVVGMHILTTSFLTGSNIASPIVGAVFSVFSSLGIELPLAPHTFGQEKAEIIIVIQ